MSHRHKMHPYMQQTASQEYAEQQAQAAQAESNLDQADLPAPEPEEIQDEALMEEIPAIEPEVDAKKEIEEMRLRMAAEMDNFKKRLMREHQEQMRYASEKVLSDLLPALDNLDLALQYATRHEACRDMMQGIEMTRKQLLDVIGKHGLKSVGEKGEPFNPEIHEAIGMDSTPELEKGLVSRVMQRGYKLNDRLLRPAKVMVNN